MARGAVPDDHPLSMGYADPALNHAVHTVFREADLFIVVGKRIDYRLALGGARLFPPDAKFIQVDLHPQELGMNRALDAAIAGDARLALEALYRGRQPGPHRVAGARPRTARRVASQAGRQPTAIPRASSTRCARRSRTTSSSPGMAAISRTGAAPSCPRATPAAGCAWDRSAPSARRCRTRSPCNWRIPDAA